nr:hypothetical protein [uncultured Flavobacterium sp.]
MTKEDLVIEFHKKLDFVENIDLRREAQDKLWDKFYLEYYGTLAPYNPNPEIISFFFNHEFYIKGHRCKISQIVEIKAFKQ